jgi:RND family efflux transporter MFP subunit
MRTRILSRTVVLSLMLLLGAVAGCRQHSGGGTKSTPKVTVAKPTVKDVTDYEDFSGRTDAVESVNVKAQATGYLKEVKFKPGQVVKKGDPLYLIDPAVYEAKTAIAQAKLVAAKTRYERLAADEGRGSGGLTEQEWEKLRGDVKEAAAAEKAADANLKSAKLDESYTVVRAGTDGRVSRTQVTVGNLVNENVTLLTTIVSEGEMYAYFDVDENRLLAYQKLIEQGKIKVDAKKRMLVEMRLGDGTPFKETGTVDFPEIRIDRGTGTRNLRAVFPDPDHKLLAGQFVTIRVPIGQGHAAALIPESAVGSDQGNKYVYVVDADNKVQSRPVTLGNLHGGLIEVTSGLTGDERLIVTGLQRVRPGMTVDPHEATENPGK